MLQKAPLVLSRQWFHQQGVKGVAVVQTESQSRLGLGHYQYPFAYLSCAVGLVFSVPEYKIENHALPDYVFSVCRYASRANEHQSNQDALTRKTATCP